MLYQKANIQIQGFERTDFSDNFFDAVIGNVPFGQFKVQDKRYDKENFLIHDYFFAKALDKVRPNGVVAFVTSKGTLDKENTKVRKYLTQRAELLGATGYPITHSRKTQARKSLRTLFFCKSAKDLSPSRMPSGLKSAKKDGVRMNRYFINHPEMVLGEMREISGASAKKRRALPEKMKI